LVVFFFDGDVQEIDLPQIINDICDQYKLQRNSKKNL
jgi:hypothetical protein